MQVTYKKIFLLFVINVFVKDNFCYKDLIAISLNTAFITILFYYFLTMVFIKLFYLYNFQYFEHLNVTFANKIKLSY